MLPTASRTSQHSRHDQHGQRRQCPRDRHCLRRQQGQAALPVALLALALLVSVGLVARWGQAALASSRAQAAADAAALATLITADRIEPARVELHDDAVATAAARAGGGELAAFELRLGGGRIHVDVAVDVDGQRATAAASVAAPSHDVEIGIPAG
ncbi:pilus assembly protein TadG-related protein [Candidatus Poriferisodalis sp.]|uniref:pilus assembly protein TadG-related protein n=1 Tax=Candidatus Poriferisodalis sp. TaxID=3101277 RepID=UPI003B02A2A0